MDGTQSSHVALPPFILKTYEMVDDASTDSIVSWSQSNESFIVWNPPEFVKDLLPRYFKHNNFSSFIRQLNTYGFRKIDPEQWEFANEDFIRGQPHLLKNIHRRKPVHSHSTQSQQGTLPLTDTERKRYDDEIARLKCDKESLALKLQRHKVEEEQINLQIKVLTERFQHLEQRQKSFLSSLAQTLQKPGLALDLVPPFDVCERKRRLPRKRYLHEEADTENNQVETLEVTATGEDSDATSISILDKKLFELLDSSVMSWEGTLLHVSDTYLQLKSSHQLDVSTSLAETPSISDEQTNVDCGSKVYGIDMNSEPAATVVPESSTLEESAAQPSTTTTAGKNDVFWEQFLTENPGSNDASEVKADRKDIAEKRNESNPGKFWWNMRNVNNIADQLGQLTPAERT